MQLYQARPNFIKEGLLIFLGALIILASVVVALKVNVLLGDIVYLVGAFLIVYSNYKEYKKISSVPDSTLVKVGLISGSIGSSLFILFMFLAMIIINVFKLIF